MIIDGKDVVESALPLTLFGGTIRKVPTKGRKQLHEIRLTNGLLIVVKATRHFMSVTFNGDISVLAHSTGLLGEYRTGDMIGRDGNVMDDFNEFALEWQFRGGEIDGMSLFRTPRAPQWPEKCRMPTTSQKKQRRLRAQDTQLYTAASEACAKLHPDDVDTCVDDVLLTGDIEMADSW